MLTEETTEQTEQQTSISLNNDQMTAWVAATAAYRTFVVLANETLQSHDSLNLHELNIIHHAMVAFDKKLAYLEENFAEQLSE